MQFAGLLPAEVAEPMAAWYAKGISVRYESESELIHAIQDNDQTVGAIVKTPAH
ncbi:hypothetical protein [Kitasatospora sp. NPDC085464]|uniref:hypothetical protein n=1 Tax=Kitasatospora sp. NPDC085464 TaxID=3364063 RepID=UPI0037CB95D7